MKKISIILAVLTISLGVVGVARAGSTNLSGWGWSQTIGWVSFNSGDSGTGDGGSGTSGNIYHVTVSTSTSPASLDGYAWSSNIGWISFKSTDVSTCGPAARVSTTTGAVTGWARATAGSTTDGGGWDGCIELSGTRHISPGDSVTGGVTLGTTSGSNLNQFQGLSWGDINTGWLSFAGVLCPGCASGDNPPPQPYQAICTVSPSGTVSAGTSVTFTVATTTSDWVGPYTYVWMGIGKPKTQTVIWTASGDTQATVTIMDSAGHSASPTCLPVTVTGGPSVGSVTCAPSSAVNASSQTYTAASTGLDAPLTYLWTGGGTTNPMTYSYSVTPSVTVTGTNGHNSASCGALTVPSGPGTGPINLFIGRNGGTPSLSSLTMSKGSQFKLRWTNTLPSLSDYTCTPQVTGNSVPSQWASGWGTGTGDTTGALDTASASYGTYHFSIICRSSSHDDALSNVVDLILYRSSLIEL